MQTVAKVVDIQFAPKRQYSSTTDDLEMVKQELEDWKDTLPDGMRLGASEGNVSVWSSLLHLSYKFVCWTSHFYFHRRINSI